MMRATAELEHFATVCGLDLEPFQRRIVRAVARGEREVVVLLPRGNGKTALMALIALHHLVDRPGRQGRGRGLQHRSQATNLFGYAERFARELGDPHVVHRHLVLRWCPEGPAREKVWTRSLEVWASDARKLHGLTYSLAIVDELQAHADASVYVAMASALHKRPGAQLVVISTAGQGADSPLGVLRSRALGQPSVTRRGAVTEAASAGLRMLAWELGDDADLSPRMVKRVNPASWITAEQLGHARDGLPELAFRRFVCNQWTERAGHWLPPGAWQRIVGTPELTEGEPIYVGVDVGGGGQEGDTAVAWISEGLQAGVEVFEGEGAELDALELIRELGRRYRVREVAFDPWRASTIAAVLEREGVLCVAFAQSDARMIPASQRLHRAVVERRLCVPGDPILARHAANAVARQSRRGWRLDHPVAGKAGVNMSAIVALAMAVDAAECQQPATELLGWL